MANGQDFRARAKFPPGSSELTNSTSFSGTDVQVIFVLPSFTPAYQIEGRTMDNTQLQTLTISSTTSVLPVRATGRAKPLAYTKGARTFAGSMVFTVLGRDPFQQIMNIDALSNTVRGDGHWHIDQMAPFDAIIMCTNEMGESGLQIIHDITLTHWGTTYSVEDIYIESTYTYVAEHVSPFISMRLGIIEDESKLKKLEDALKSSDKSLDAAAAQCWALEHEKRHDLWYLPEGTDLDTLRFGNIQLDSRSPLSLVGGLSEVMNQFNLTAYQKFVNIFGISPETAGLIQF